MWLEDVIASSSSSHESPMPTLPRKKALQTLMWLEDVIASSSTARRRDSKSTVGKIDFTSLGHRSKRLLSLPATEDGMLGNSNRQQIRIPTGRSITSGRSKKMKACQRILLPTRGSANQSSKFLSLGAKVAAFTLDGPKSHN